MLQVTDNGAGHLGSRLAAHGLELNYQSSVDRVGVRRASNPGALDAILAPDTLVYPLADNASFLEWFGGAGWNRIAPGRSEVFLVGEPGEYQLFLAFEDTAGWPSAALANLRTEERTDSVLTFFQRSHRRGTAFGRQGRADEPCSELIRFDSVGIRDKIIVERVVIHGIHRIEGDAFEPRLPVKFTNETRLSDTRDHPMLYGPDVTQWPPEVQRLLVPWTRD